MKKIEWFLTFLLGLICGVALTRFMYGAALNLTMFLLILAAALVLVIIFKLNSAKKDIKKKLDS